MSRLADYRDRYEFLRLEREGGVLEATLHTDGGPFRFGPATFAGLPDAFHDIGRDPDNRVVILTGTGDEFCGPRAGPGTRFFASKPPAAAWETGLAGDYRLIGNHLNIEVPMIAAVNGPAHRRAELALLCDIVLAAPGASFVDSHFQGSGLVPGDGLGQLFMTLMGLNRARYLLLTGKALSAGEALAAGLIGEVVPDAQLLPRARAIAADLAAKPPLLLRSTRALLTHPLKQAMANLLSVGQYMEVFAGSNAEP